MKQIVPFTKRIELKTNVEEITSISLDNTLKSNNNNEIIGEFQLYFEYKENDISVNIEKHEECIPFNINLDDKYKLLNAKIEIDDFYYEIDETDVILHIDVLIDNIELKEEEIESIITRHEEIEELELDDIEPIDEDINRKTEIEDLFEEMDDDIPLEVNNTKLKKAPPIFNTFDIENETYVTYSVHIVRNDDNIDSICQKYNVTREELSNYNEIKEIKLGDKLIVPTYKK